MATSFLANCKSHAYSCVDDGLIFAPGTAVPALCAHSEDHTHEHNLVADYGYHFEQSIELIHNYKHKKKKLKIKRLVDMLTFWFNFEFFKNFQHSSN